MGAQGERAGLVTQGMGGIFAAVQEAVQWFRRWGRTKEQDKEKLGTLIYAKLVNVNGEKPSVNISGTIFVEDSAKHVTVKLAESTSYVIRKAWDAIKITVKRVR